MMQYPAERGHTVLLLKSGEGTGKNIIADMFVRAFGQHATVATNTDDLVGKFNDHLGTSVFVFANEAVWGGNKALEGALKALITDEELSIEKKYVPKYRVKNCCHVLMASNNDWAAPIGIDDRRFVVLPVSDKYKGNSAYFDALRAHIEAGGESAFMRELLDMDISQFNPRVLPDIKQGQTNKLEMMLEGADSVTQWLFDVLWEGQALLTVEQTIGGRKQCNILPNWEDRPVQVSTHHLRGAYEEWCKTNHKRTKSAVAFGRKLFDLCSIQRIRVGAGSEREYAYRLDDLGSMRRDLGSKLRLNVDWPEIG